MRHPFLVALCAMFVIACGGKPSEGKIDAGTVLAPAPVVPAGPRRKVLIVPMACRAAAKSHCAFALGLPAVLAERLESDPGIEPINAPSLVLTPEQAALLPADRELPVDLAAANALALAKGAEYFVTGAFGKWVWKWTFEVRIYAARKEGPEIVGTNDASIGDPEGEVSVIGARNDVGGERLHRVYADAVAKAFADADLALAETTVAAIATPDTKNGYAFLLLSRAYVARFTGRDFGDAVKDDVAIAEDAGLSRAAHAVTVDPKNPVAQRFYAALLLSVGKRGSARVHYEQALKYRPNDLRVLIGLGDLEIADGNPDVAKGYLNTLVRLHPTHAHAHALLAKATLALGDVSKAISLYEQARDLAPLQPVPHTALLELYADARRYADAAHEAEALTGIQRDAKPWYLLGANLRAAGLRDKAIAAYAEGARKFPKEFLLHLFRGDILREDGRKAEAKAAYTAGSVASWYNERLEAYLKGWKSPFLGGKALVDVIEKNGARLQAMKAAKADFSLGVNDATLDFRAFGQAACVSGAGASSAKFARAAAQRYQVEATALATDAWRIKETFMNREYQSLTTDELVRARKVIASAWPAERAWREMRTAWRRGYLPALARAHCDRPAPVAAPTEIAALEGAPLPTPVVPEPELRPETEDTTRERIEARMVARVVALPEVAPPLYGIPVSPSIPPQSADMVTFSVDLRQGSKDRQVWLDGAKLGDVIKGTVGQFTAPKGPHALCVAPAGIRCGAPGTIRNRVSIHGGWTIAVRPGG